MKKLLVLLFTLVIIAAVIPVSAVTANGSFGEVPLYKGTITLDGKKDAIFDKGLILDIGPWSDTYKDEKSTAKLYLLHDGTYIYAFVDVKSAYALTDYNTVYAEQPSAWKTTCIEMTIDFTNKAASKNDCFKTMLWYTNEMWFSYKSLKDVNGIETKTTVDKTNKSFTGEYKIKLQEGAKTGNDIGFNVVVDLDANMGPKNEHNRKMLGLHINSSIDNDGSKFKSVTLSSKEVAADTTAAAATKAAVTTAGAAKTGTAAKTADISVIFAAVIVSAGAAATLLKKKH